MDALHALGFIFSFYCYVSGICCMLMGALHAIGFSCSLHCYVSGICCITMDAPHAIGFIVLYNVCLAVCVACLWMHDTLFALFVFCTVLLGLNLESILNCDCRWPWLSYSPTTLCQS